MLRLLREDGVAGEFRRLSGGTGDASVAAPFWGDGAAARLGLRKRRPLRILCRFESPACNPVALLELAKVGAAIRSHPRLHAKVYLAGGAAIIGSSNPSVNGVTQEGDTVGGSIEANVLTDEHDVVRGANALFDGLWTGRETVEITVPMIEREIRLRALNPPSPVRRALGDRTLVAACREAPELFEPVVVCAYDEGLGPKGREALLQLQRQASGTGSGLDASSFRRCWGYQMDEPPPPGFWIVDLDCKRDVPVVHGASQVPSPVLRLKVDGENDLVPTVRGVVSVPGARGSFRMAREEKDQLAAVARKLLCDGRSFVPLAEVVAMIDGRRGGRPRTGGA